jgi:TolB-like protein
MKRCPNCGRDYNDPTLSFCLDDGTPLLDGPASLDEPLTAVLPDGVPTNESATRTLDAGEAEATRVFAEKGEKSTAKPASRKASIFAGIIVAIVITTLGIGGYLYYSGRDSSKQIESIAVMPFVNESGNADVEYLSDGMTETLISSLSEIPDLSVKARSTVFYFKGKNKSPREIGEELGVEAVLLGRLVQREDNLKISLELVDTSTLDAVWSQSYDRKMSDLVALQSEIARNVSDKLRLRLTASEQQKVARSGTASAEAQQLYLKGLFHFNKRFGQGNGSREMDRAISFYQQAVDKDPNYALAHAGLAAAYSLIPYLYPRSSQEFLPKGKEAARIALKLDPNLAEAHAALGNVLLYSYDWDGAKRSYLKAIEVNPKYPKGHQWYADYLASEGRFDESLEKFEKALELDPFDLVLNNSKIRILLSAEKFDEAISETKKFVEMFPDSSLGARFLREAYFGKGMEREAMEQYWIALEKNGESEDRIAALKGIYNTRGIEGFRQENLINKVTETNAILEKDKNAFVGYRGLLNAYADVKDTENTLKYLDKAYQRRDPMLVDLKKMREYDFLKDEPRFQELLKKIGFPE